MAGWSELATAAVTLTGGGIAKDEPIDISGSNPAELFGSLVWVIVSLAIVIVLIVLALKWLSQRNRAWGSNRSLRLLGGVSLGQHSSLQVIEIADRIYIVGVGENITLIDKLDAPEQTAALLAALERQSETGWSANPLAQLVRKWRNREPNEGAGPVNDQWNNASSFESLLQSKLNQRADRKQQLDALLKDSKSDERLMDNEK